LKSIPYVVALALMVTACSALLGTDKATPFNADPLKPLVDIPMPPPRTFEGPSETQYCFANEEGIYSSDVNVDQGDADDYVWGQGGACIFRPIREVWAVAHNQELLVWGGVDESSFKMRSDKPEGITHFYEIEYFVDDIIDVDWKMHWYHSVRDGAFETPLQILINYKKVSGTRFIRYWEGTFLLHQVTPEITAITMRNQIKASRTNSDDAASTIRTIINKLRTGTPNWGPL